MRQTVGDGTGSSLHDLREQIRAINPGYLASATGTGHFRDRLQTIFYSPSRNALFLVVAERFVFRLETSPALVLREVAEVNHDGSGLVGDGLQTIDAITETLAGTILLLGSDRRDGEWHGVAWRLEAGDGTFRRVVVAEPAWQTTRAGNATAGFFGPDREEVVAIAPYASPARLLLSRDDGLTWRHHSLATLFANHVHEVYLPRAIHPERTARLWVTGGDDPSGAASGLVSFDGFDAQGELRGGRFALREQPGYRLVGLTGNGRDLFVGNESLAGGVLRIQDNEQAIAISDFEYVLTKGRHDYHQMRSLLATADGVLISGTDSYGHVGDTIRADSGGYLYLSTDDGASCRTIPLGAKWVTGIACDGTAFWVTFGMGREEGPDCSASRLSLLRIPKPPVWADVSDDYVVKLLIADSSDFYRAAGYDSHPVPVLARGATTFRVDMAPFRSLALLVDSHEPGELSVETLPFRDWHPDQERWTEIRRLRIRAAGRQQILLREGETMSRHFRVRNAGRRPIALRQLAFVGRK
ncbi:MAG: hypothetical protein GX178_11280 [Acidobacteria bacterium]|nr:hypothetical protein [Thermoanaerobaculia bacterium]MBP7813643.1 hypothetical protein [Thermoanaerobaculia bacterium]MBP8845165.1 hypothetical protein [Thermoanaerobaculia bacterium]NLN12174.1 hypothetical protein [Acidobacteriota bacterium]